MRRRALPLAGLLAFAVAPLPAGARATGDTSGAPVGGQPPAGRLAAPGVLGRPAPRRLRPHAFASCTELVSYARRHFAVTHGVAEPVVRPQVEKLPGRAPQGAGGSTRPGAAAPVEGSPPADAPGFSTTNNQETGVEEPDIVKTDGATIFAVSQGTLRAVAVRGTGPALVGSLALGAHGFGAQLLRSGSRLIVISGGGAVGVGIGVAGPPRPGLALSRAGAPYYGGAKTVLTEVDAHDPAAMKVTRTMTVDGAFVDARQNGSSARLVISSGARAVADAGVRAKASGWLPRRQFHSLISGRHYARPAVTCNSVRRPTEFSGLGMLTILTVDIDRGLWTADSHALMADAQVVYGSERSLYVATQRWVDPQLAPSQLPAAQTTVIDRFDVSGPQRTTLVSSGEVPGYLLNQFSLSERGGYLRVATSSRPIWWRGGAPESLSQSYVTVLADRGGLLVPVGQVSGLGAGQQIYSVRFVEDTAYVVTFRQVDPLYTVDLRSPTAPRVAGQLELQGYSAYLHPVGDGLLLGIGRDVGPSANEPSGTQVELFDVSDSSAPKLLGRTTLGEGSSSEVQYDHHAFLFWPPTKLAVLPVEIFATTTGPPQGKPQPAPAGPTAGRRASGPSTSDGFVGAIAFRVDRSGIAEAGRIVHDASNGSTPMVRRSIVIGGRLFTVSDGGVMASSLDTLARQAFAGFAAPPPQPLGASPGRAPSSRPR